MMSPPRPKTKTLRLDASHVRPVASLFPTGTNAPVLSPPSIGMPTSSNGRPDPHSNLCPLIPLVLQPGPVLHSSGSRARRIAYAPLCPWPLHRDKLHQAAVQAPKGQTFRRGAYPVPSF